MPLYDFECNACGHRVENILCKLSEAEEFSLEGKPCKAPNQCLGIYEQTFEPKRTPNFFFKGGAPTPKFHK